MSFIDWGGDPTGSHCLECGGEIVFNGNYFCENVSEPGDHFVLDPEDDSPETRALFEELYAGLLAARHV